MVQLLFWGSCVLISFYLRKSLCFHNCTDNKHNKILIWFTCFFFFWVILFLIWFPWNNWESLWFSTSRSFFPDITNRFWFKIVLGISVPSRSGYSEVASPFLSLVAREKDMNRRRKSCARILSETTNLWG